MNDYVYAMMRSGINIYLIQQLRKCVRAFSNRFAVHLKWRTQYIYVCICVRDFLLFGLLSFYPLLLLLLLHRNRLNLCVFIREQDQHLCREHSHIFGAFGVKR